MILQAVVLQESKNGKTRKYLLYHPTDLRKHVVWIPVSQIKELTLGQILIPDWLWDIINDKL